jgi:hypothetical protein
MQQNVNPAIGAVIAIVVVVVVGFFGWKMFAAPKGIAGTPPASATDPNGYMPPASSYGRR